MLRCPRGATAAAPPPPVSTGLLQQPRRRQRVPEAPFTHSSRTSARARPDTRDDGCPMLGYARDSADPWGTSIFVQSTPVGSNLHSLFSCSLFWLMSAQQYPALCLVAAQKSSRGINVRITASSLLHAKRLSTWVCEYKSWTANSYHSLTHARCALCTLQVHAHASHSHQPSKAKAMVECTRVELFEFVLWIEPR